MNTEESLWDIDEVAKYLKASKDSVYRWIYNKGMPSLKIGKKWLFRKAEVDAWLDSMQKRHTESGKEGKP